MLKLKGRTAQFAPAIPEQSFLRFCQSAGLNVEPHPIMRFLDSYFVEFLSTEKDETSSKLSIAYALWDLDRTAGLSHLVAYHGFDASAVHYPVVLNSGEGIAGGMLQRLMSERDELRPYVAADISEDRVVAGKELLLQTLHYRAAIVFPVFIGTEPRGALKVYSSHKLHPSVVKDQERLMIETARISAVVALASRMATANLRDVLSENFRDLDLLNPEHPPDVQMKDLEETVQRCIDAVRRATSARLCRLDLGQRKIESRSENSTEPDHTTDHISHDLNTGERAGGSRLNIWSREDGLRFSLFDRHLLDHAVKLLSQYVDKYFTLQDFTQKWRRRGLLLEATNKLSSQLLKSSERDAIINHLLLGIQKGFGFFALAFLRLDGERLIPQRCVPDSFHERVAKRNLKLRVLAECVYEKKIDWSIEDCVTCRACEGFTAIAALRRQTISVPNLPKTPLKILQVDPGIPATAEYVFPLIVDAKVYGVLDVYSDGAVTISDDELNDVYGLCHSASLALSNRNLGDRLAKLQMDEAEGELAREVVHTVIPTVSELAIHADLIRKSLDSLQGPMDPTRHKHLMKSATQAIASLSEAISQQRDIVERYEVRSRLSETAETAVELGHIVASVKEFNALRAEQKGIAINIRPPEGVERRLWLSELYMYLILWNLVQNAVKFSRGKHGEQVVVSHSFTDDVCVIRVTDQGVGIPKENRSKVWEPNFSTVAPGAKRATTGQGLTIVSDLVRRTELASIDFTSTNHGTEFTITISQGRKYVEDKLKQQTAS